MLFLAACSTLPENFSSHNSGTWAAKALIQDLKNNNSYIVNIDIAAVRSESLRLDVSTSLAIHLASMTYHKGAVEVLLPQQKRYYKGKSSPKAFRKLAPIEFDPKWLIDVLFDQELPTASWKCTRDENQQLKLCENQNVKVEWVKRQRQMRLVNIDTGSAKLQLQLKGFEAESIDPKKFKLPPVPASVKSYKL